MNIVGKTFDNPFLFLVCSSLLKHISCALWFIRNANRRVASYAGTLSEIRLYPLKSGRVLKLQTAECSSTGLVTAQNGWLVRDRHWMVVKEHDGYEFLTARTEPRLSMIQTSLSGTNMRLDAPDMDTLVLSQLMKKQDHHKVITATVWGEEIECIDGGETAAAWICRYLGRERIRLVHAAANLSKRQVDQSLSGTKCSDEAAFQDGFPYMLISEESLADLNSRLESPVLMDNFRPNLVARDCQAFDEDSWDEVQIGEAVFKNVKPCTRCIMTTVDPAIGKRHPEMQPLRTLKKYRKKVEEYGDDPLFGVNFVLEKAGRVNVGDAIYVTSK